MIESISGELMLYFNIILAPAIGLIVILIDYRNRHPEDAVQKKLFTLLICCILTAMASDTLFAAVNGMPMDVLRIINWAACTFYFLLMVVSFSIVILLYEHTLNGDIVRLKKMTFVLTIFNAVYITMLIINSFTQHLFYISYNNFYVRGDWYLIVFTVPNLLVMFMLFNIFLNRKNINLTMFILALVSTFPVVTGSIFDILWEDSLIIWQSFFISLLFLYLFFIHKIALIDSLTNAYNRRGLDEYMISIEKSSRRKTYVFIVIDVDQFKKINDQFGHAHGDTALRDTVDILRSSVRRSDFIARYGGDEFVIVAAATNVDTIIDNIISNFKAFNTKKARPYTLALSCGGDIYLCDDPRTPSEFLSYVDTLMYAEKERRRKTY